MSAHEDLIGTRFGLGLVRDALAFAAAAHEGQKRKYTGEDYIRHPIEVVDILRWHFPRDDEMLAAAALHDVVEDTAMTHKDIRQNFPESVALMVADLTDQFIDPSDGNRALRKALETRRLSFCEWRSQTIKVADLISNTKSIVAHDPKFAVTYLREKQALLDALTKASEPLRKRALREVAENGWRLTLAQEKA